MSYKSEVENLIQNLHRVAEKRQEFAGYLNQVVAIIQRAEAEGAKPSGQAFLAQEIAALQKNSESLQNGRFRLMVLGDMKQGKSTLLNVLFGRKLLPCDVKPCTAILTLIKYGQPEKVTVHFKDGHTQSMSFEEFSRDYSIPDDEAKGSYGRKEPAFPDVNHAEVEYPLELLQNGVEIVDSPGLNDTDERNELSLGYVSSCQAILFVLNATQPCTIDERRYLENFLKGRGLTIFFLINRWDELQKEAFDPNDEIEVRKHENAQRQVFKSHLQDYCIVEGTDLYENRVFETSGLNALRACVKGEPMTGTGMPEFIGSLEEFLTEERAVSEFHQARSLMRQTYNRLRETVERRIPMLGQDIEELKSRIQSVQPAFSKLQEIRDEFRDTIKATKEKSAEDIAQSAYNFFSQLDKTFEEDFRPYVPPLDFFKFLWKGSRKEFEEKMNEGFKKYINDKMSQWGKSAEKDLRSYTDRLALKATEYGFAYQGVTDKIDAHLTGLSLNINNIVETTGDAAPSPGWATFASGATAFLLGDWVGAAGAATGTFNFGSLLKSLAVVIGANVLLDVLFGLVLGPVGIAAVMGLTNIAGAEGMRREFLKKTRESIKKELPNMAKASARTVHDKILHLFEEYETEAIKRINDDIKSRKAELELLLEQKENGEIQKESEVQRLHKLDRDVYEQLQLAESSYDDLMGQKSGVAESECELSQAQLSRS